MLLVDVLFALLVAAVLSFLFVPLVSVRSGRTGGVATTILFFFLILFLATWAGGIWLTPFGPTAWGGFWLPFVAIGLFVALLLAAASEPTRQDLRRRSEAHAQEAEAHAEAAEVTMFGVLFWVLVIGLLTVVIARYAVG